MFLDNFARNHTFVLSFKLNYSVILTTFFAYGFITQLHLIAFAASSNSQHQVHTVIGRGSLSSDPQKRLKELEKSRKELQVRASEVRKKEKLALLHLSHIKNQLSHANKELKTSKNQLKNTEVNIKQCENSLSNTETQEQNLSSQAASRLRQMYEGQRLGLLEMLFQVSSLQQLIDLMYFQERVAEMDKELIADLKARERALAAQRHQLDSRKMQLGDIVSEFAKKAMILNKEKSEQEQVADKLRTQRNFYEAAEHQLSRESSQLEQQIMAMMKAHKSQSSRVVVQGSGSMSMPLHASITSPFGWRRHPIFGVRKFHTGIDLAGPNRSAIKAADGGSVLYTGWYGGYGKVVIIGHGNNLATLYAHLCKAAVSVGQNVSKGDVIGYEGSTGFSTGPHLHFEVRVDGKPNNPLNFVR